MKFTKEQQQVIDLRGKNLLVSAAAGSGKTAVLVGRIIKRISGDESPVDIDKLLIVTYTNAAAAEMRERIGAAIERKLDEFPDDTNLKRQQTLIHNARITTIHSFCLFILREFFHRIDMEPDFRIGDEGELKLLKGDVLDDVLEKYYQEKDPVFLRLSETLAVGKHDLQLRDLVLVLFDFSMSYPWPEEWLKECAIPYQARTMEEFERLPLAKILLQYCESLTKQWVQLMGACVRISGEPDGPSIYGPLLEQELEMLEQVAKSSNLTEFYETISAVSFGRLPAARKNTKNEGFPPSPEKKQLVQDSRNDIKSSRKKIMEQIFSKPPKELVEDLGKNREIIEMLIRVTLDFSDAFAEEKREKNLLDFNDLEHFALKILVDTDTKELTQTAQELQLVFEEIMIDEYQDSNYVQETILKSVSREGKGIYNLFMVGDVKQSIYRFRMARPELFMEKYDSYSIGEGEKRRIDLHKNFRSRPEVLETVNDIFYRIMAKDLGNVEYNAVSALYPGMEFVKPEPGMDHMFQTEVLVADTDSFQAVAEDAGEVWNAKETEAAMIAVKILQLLEVQQVTDRETEELRPIKYEDIVILLRSPGSYAGQLIQTLDAYGIPAQVAASTGYFSAIEVQTVLNMLRLIDNPRQDIPLAAILKSPIGGLDGEEMAAIRIQFPEGMFHKAVFSYANGGMDEDLKEKLKGFLTQLETFRNRVSYTSIHALLFQVMEETGYFEYTFALPGGQGRRANLEMLLEKAIAYESTSYRGLFHFIRYINQLQTYEVDYGEAEDSYTEDAVRIMSIHKSKGLEFPVVFVAGLGKQFNQQDVRSRLILHPQLGIGLDITDVERRIRTPSITRQALARQIQMENAGEELRVLYVALTRAREKLILTGTLKNAEKKLRSMEYQIFNEEGHTTPIHRLGFLARLNAHSFWDWILKAVKSYGGKYEIQLLGPKYLTLVQIGEQVKEELTKGQLWERLKESDGEWDKAIDESLSFQYPYAGEEDMKTKISVSELKHRAIDLLRLEESYGEYMFEEKELIPYIPEFIQRATEENTAALRGTAMHRVLECFDFTKDRSTLQDQLDEMRLKKQLDEKLYELVSIPGLKSFLCSRLAERMGKAAKKGLFYREKPFVMGKPAKEVLEGSDSDEMILIQGIMDAFFEEEGQLVLVDYKTDKVKDVQELTHLYRTQMELYQEAMERATGKKVKEKYLYSFKLRKAVLI